MRTFKRFLSLFVVLMMVISMVPATVFAAETEDQASPASVTDGCYIGDTYYATLQEAVNAANDGDTITVHGTLSDETVAVKKNVNIVGADGATLNDVIIEDALLTPEEELAALTDGDIYKGGSKTWSYKPSNMDVVDATYVAKGPDPLYPELGNVIYADVSKGHAANPNYY
ncbi:MAG: hypothetical protein IJD38_13185, partial [Clostridia bacterium]|nr:hypothetical protein [Clostridia bacterium]